MIGEEREEKGEVRRGEKREKKKRRGGKRGEGRGEEKRQNRRDGWRKESGEERSMTDYLRSDVKEHRPSDISHNNIRSGV